jgi:hypothetical protein
LKLKTNMKPYDCSSVSFTRRNSDTLQWRVRVCAADGLDSSSSDVDVCAAHGLVLHYVATLWQSHLDRVQQGSLQPAVLYA